jgi:hypothetical protein
MADILPFVTRERRRADRADGRSAEIVIFPGVRVEYHDDRPGPETKRQGRSGRRGRKAAASA